MQLFKCLHDLHQCDGLAGYISPTIELEYSVQLYSKIVHNLTLQYFLQTSGTDLDTTEAVRVSEQIPCGFSVDDPFRTEAHVDDKQHQDAAASQESAEGGAEDWSGDMLQVPDVPIPDPVYYEEEPQEPIEDPRLKYMTNQEPQFTIDKSEFKVIPKDPRKLYISNINFRTPPNKLWSFMEKFGAVSFCEHLKDRKTSRYKGRGFVTYKSESSAWKALDSGEEERELDGRTVNIERAVWRQYKRVGRDLEHEEHIALQQKIAAAPPAVHDPDAPLHSGDLDVLNDVCLTHVFAFFTVKERVRVERVCRRFRYISDSLWRVEEQLSFNGLVTGFGALTERVFLSIIQRNLRSLKHLDVSASPRLLGDKCLRAIGKHCPNLRHLDISGMPVSNKALQDFSDKCPLESVVMKNCSNIGEEGLWWLFHKCKNLTHIDMEGNLRAKGKCFHVCTSNLRTINLNGCKKLQNVALDKLTVEGKQLTELRISGCTMLGDRALLTVGQGCEWLKTLDVGSMSTSITPSGFCNISKLSNLEELILRDNRGVTDVVIATISQGCKRLRVLEMSCHSSPITSQTLVYLSTLPVLEILNISHLTEVTSEGLQCIATKGRLKQLTARNCAAVDDMSFQCLMNHCTKLTILDICGCYDVTVNSIPVVKAAFEGIDRSQLCILSTGTGLLPLEERWLDLCPGVVLENIPFGNYMQQMPEYVDEWGDDYHDDGDYGDDDYDLEEVDDPLFAERFQMS